MKNGGITSIATATTWCWIRTTELAASMSIVSEPRAAAISCDLGWIMLEKTKQDEESANIVDGPAISGFIHTRSIDYRQE